MKSIHQLRDQHRRWHFEHDFFEFSDIDPGIPKFYIDTLKNLVCDTCEKTITEGSKELSAPPPKQSKLKYQGLTGYIRECKESGMPWDEIFDDLYLMHEYGPRGSMTNPNSFATHPWEYIKNKKRCQSNYNKQRRA